MAKKNPSASGGLPKLYSRSGANASSPTTLLNSQLTHNIFFILAIRNLHFFDLILLALEPFAPFNGVT
jgi:hypothetical protein